MCDGSWVGISHEFFSVAFCRSLSLHLPSKVIKLTRIVVCRFTHTSHRVMLLSCCSVLRRRQLFLNLVDVFVRIGTSSLSSDLVSPNKSARSAVIDDHMTLDYVRWSTISPGSCQAEHGTRGQSYPYYFSFNELPE